MYVSKKSMLLPVDDRKAYIHNFADSVVECLSQCGISVNVKKFESETNLRSSSTVSSNDLPGWIYYNAICSNLFVNNESTTSSSSYFPSYKTVALVYWIVDGVRYSMFIGGGYNSYTITSAALGLMIVSNSNDEGSESVTSNIWGSRVGNMSYSYAGFGIANYRDKLTIARGSNTFAIFVYNEYYSSRICWCSHVKTNYNDGVYIPGANSINKIPVHQNLGSTLILGSLAYAMGGCSTALGDVLENKHYLFDVHLGIQDGVIFGKCIDLYSIPLVNTSTGDIINIGGIFYARVGSSTYAGNLYMKVG